MTYPKFSRWVFIVCLLSGWDSDPHWFSSHSCHLHFLAYYRVILDPGFPLSCFCSHPPAPWVCVTFQSSPKWKVGCFPSERSFINWLLGVGMRIQHKIMLQSLSLQGSPFWGQRFPACSAGVKLGVGNSVDFSGHGREEPLHPTTCSRVRCKKMAPT